MQRPKQSINKPDGSRVYVDKRKILNSNDNNNNTFS